MNPLDQLADIHLPEPLGYWPLAWGWWLLIGFTLCAIAAGLYYAIKTRRKNAYRKQALNELQQINFTYAQQPQAYLQAVNQLLHRCALHSHQLDNFSLSGDAWLNWLSEQCKATERGFSEGIGRALLNGPYQANFSLSDTEKNNLHELIKTWLKKHHWTEKHQWTEKQKFTHKHLGGQTNV